MKEIPERKEASGLDRRNYKITFLNLPWFEIDYCHIKKSKNLEIYQ